jgi:hypothetical protein
MKDQSSAKVLPPVAKLLNLHRRKQQVVVTTSSRTPIHSGNERRRRCPTLPGLGYRVELDTIAAENVDFDEEPPISCVRPKTRGRSIPQAARVPKRPKPVTLFDGGIDDQRAQDYLEEAAQILKSGIFDN